MELIQAVELIQDKTQISPWMDAWTGMRKDCYGLKQITTMYVKLDLRVRNHLTEVLT